MTWIPFPINISAVPLSLKKLVNPGVEAAGLVEKKKIDSPGKEFSNTCMEYQDLGTSHILHNFLITFFKM